MAASEADGCAGVGDALGWLVGRALAGKTGRVGRPVGLAGWLGHEAEQPGLRGLLFFSFLFCFSFLLLYLNSILIFKLVSRLVHHIRLNIS